MAIGDRKLTINPAAASDVNSPNSASSDYLAMAEYWAMVDDILGGAEAVRSKGEKYLSRFFNETTKPDRNPYLERLNVAPFTNLYEDISRNLASKPFAEECELEDDSGEEYKRLAENIDGQGNNLHVFAQSVFQDAVDHAISWIFIDHTRAAPRPDGQVLSIADEAAQGLRPYWVHIPATRMLAVYSDFVGGEEVIYHARIYEPTTMLDGYQERTVERIRVLKRDAVLFDQAGKPMAYGQPYWELWESITKDAKSSETTWSQVDGGFFSLSALPLVPFVTGTRDPASWRVRPPLRGIAHMQIQEYNQESNLKTVMELTCFPMLSGDGITPQDNGEEVPVGPRAVLYGGSSVDGKPGSWRYIEPGAQSITALSSQLDKTQNAMRDLGMQPLTMQNLTVITTGQVAVKANSAVKAWALKFKDALEEAWVYTAEWLGQNEKRAPDVYVFTDFNVVLDQGQGWAAVWQMRQNKDVSHETVITSAMRYGYLWDNFDVKQNDEELAKEADDAALEAEQMIDPRTGKPVQQATNGSRPPPGTGKAPSAVMQGQRVTQ